MSSEWKCICQDSYEATLFQVAAILAFLGAFRISNLVVASKEDKSKEALQITDVSWQQGLRCRGFWWCILSIGHSYVYRAEKYVTRTAWGRNLGL
ncbi:hypothetical protein JRQ81_004060, partial [Phrynocephalus forsythii]